MTRLQKLGIAALFVAVTAMTITGCGSSGSDGTYNEAPASAQTQTVLTGDDAGDITATQISAGGDVQVGDNQEITVQTESGAVTLDASHFFDPETTPTTDLSPDPITLNAADDPATCEALGGFWCSIEQACLGLNDATATCPGS